MTPLEVIQYRVSMRKEPWRKELEDKWETLRQITNGDLSPIGMMSDQTMTSRGDEKVPANAIEGAVSREQTNVRSITLGATNSIQATLKSICQQLSMQAPTFDFKNIQGEVEQFHREYMEMVWSETEGCDAVSSFEQSIWDMLICGVGFPGVTLSGTGRPVVTRYMPDRVLWDRVETIQKGRWCAIWETRRAQEWADMFESAAAKEALSDFIEKNEPVELVFYYDVEGEDGTSAVFMASDNDASEEPIDGPTDSPWYVIREITERVSKKELFLPFVPLVYSNPSGAATPVGLVEMALPSQLFLFAAERAKVRHLSMKSHLVVNTTSLGSKSRDELAKGNVPDVWESNGDAATLLSIVAPPPLDPALLDHEEQCRAFLKVVSEDSPYSSGIPQGVEFAREVDAIQSQGVQGLSSLRIKVARVVEAVATRFLWLASEMDTEPIRLSLGGTILSFDEEDPIAGYLDPHAGPVVSEDSMRYRSPQERLGAELSKANFLAQYGLPQVALEVGVQAFGDKKLSSLVSNAQQELQQLPVNQ